MSTKAPVRRGQSTMGEYTQEQLIEKLQNGMISCYDEIYMAKTDEWIEIVKIKGMRQYISEDFHWKYRIQGEVRGPYAKTDLIFFIQDGKVKAKDWVYHPRLEDFKKVEDIDEFKQYITEKEEKKSEVNLDEAMESSFYKICPNCGMQNLRSSWQCKGCKYIFKDAG